MSVSSLIERLIFAEAFSLWSLSVIVLAMALYAFITKKTFDRNSLAFIALSITAGSYLFSQTTFFSNIFGLVSPDRELFPDSVPRAIALGLLSLAMSFWIAFLTGYQRNLWAWIVGIVSIGAAIAFIFEPYLLRY